MKVLALGGGPASVLFAYQVKKTHPAYDVSIIEKDEKILKRILVSGNGRANFFNAGFSSGKAHKAYSDEDGFRKSVASDEIKTFKEILQELGLVYYSDEEGRFYPFANVSSSLRSCLIDGLSKAGVTIKTSCNVLDIKPEIRKAITDKGVFGYDHLFIGLGGGALDRSGDDLMKIISGLKVSIDPLVPALCPLRTVERIPSYMSGLRLKGCLCLYKNGKKTYEEPGELLFKDDGISGICVFDASLYLEGNLSQYTISFDPTQHDGVSIGPDVGTDIAKLKGAFPFQLLKYLDGKNTILNRDGIVDCLTFHIRERYGFKNAQITKGGISLSEINSDMSLRKHPDILAGGEIVNLHAICGGYNMGLAFLSGLRAAKGLR